jgi:SOS response regulatory protein OraA/RecX
MAFFPIYSDQREYKGRKQKTTTFFSPDNEMKGAKKAPTLTVEAHTTDDDSTTEAKPKATKSKNRKGKTAPKTTAKVQRNMITRMEFFTQGLYFYIHPKVFSHTSTIIII